MLRINRIIILVLVIGLSIGYGLLNTKPGWADENRSVTRDYDNSQGVSHRVIYHPNLDVKVWVDKGEGALYHPGEDIKVYFRASHDCYVVLYDIDTRGYVHLLYPTDTGDDPYVEGGRVYRIPNRLDDYDLTVDGPNGVEYIQVVASLEPIDYPNFPGAYSEENEEIYAYKLDGEDPYEFMEDINSEIVSSDYAADVCIFNVEYPHPKWYYWPEVVYVDRPVDLVWGGAYFGYPWGVEVWIDGVFYGITPLTIPALVVGRHYCSFWFHGGWIWRDWFHVRYDHILRVWPDCGDRYRYVEERFVEKSYRAEKAKRRRGAEESGGLVKPVQYRERERVAKMDASRLERDKEYKKDQPTKRRGTENRLNPSRLSDDVKSRRTDKEIKQREIRKVPLSKRSLSLPERKIEEKEIRPVDRKPRKIEREYENSDSRGKSLTPERIRKNDNPKPKAKTEKIERQDREQKTTKPATIQRAPVKTENTAPRQPQGTERSQPTKGGETRGDKSQGRRR